MFSRRASAVVIVALVTLALLASLAPVFAAPASALPLHARLLKATPADGSRVATASEVVLGFNEDVDPQFVRVVVEGPRGLETTGDPVVEGRSVTQALAPDLPAGRHTVTYRVVSADGHPISGKVGFTTTSAPSASASTTPSPSPSVTVTGPSPTATPAPSATPTTDDVPTSAEGGTSPWVWVLLGGVLLAALLGLATQRRLLGGPKDDERAHAEADTRPADTRPDGRDDPFA